MLLWLDLETTGLDPIKNHILEVAWTFTNADLSQIQFTKMASTLVTPSLEAWDQIEENEFILKMHTDSGLYDDLKEQPTLDVSDVEDFILQDIELLYFPEGEPLYLAGASVHFDLAFIRNWMPRLAAKLSHRVYDTSTLKAFFEEFVTLPSELGNKGQHRAINDVEEVLNVARHLRDYVHFATSTLIDLQERGLINAPINVDEESNA